MPRTKWVNPAATKEYYAWRGMRHRCTNPRNASWHNYGGRGINVCDRWVNDYDAFFQDMGPCPDGMTLDRIDSAKGYSPENCRWADWFTQANNKRTNVKIEYEGEVKTVAQWAKVFGLRTDTLFKRLQRMSPEKAFTSENLVEKNTSPLIHGTRVGYEKYSCRCKLCRGSNAKRHREYMAGRAVSQAKSV